MGIDASCCVDEDNSAPPYGHTGSTSETEPINKNSKRFQWTKQKKIPLKSGYSFGEPLINGDNILFVSSFNDYIIIKSYNIKNKTYSKAQEFECKNASFNIQQSVYTFDATNNLIYFINNNQQMTTLNLQTKKLITIQNISTDNNKFAQISKVEDKIYILGAANSGYDDQKSDNVVFIPYDAYKEKGQQHKSIELLQKKFGKASVTVNVSLNYKNYIYIMGGGQAFDAPSDAIWILDLSLINESGFIKDNIGDYKWKKRFLCCPMNSFGIINYKNKYLITFGGFLYKRKKLYWSNEIHILDLNDGKWYVLNKKLKLKCGYFAVYNGKEDIVHLFAWNGKHFTIEIKDIIDEFNTGCISLMQSWTEQGKTVLPTKSKSFRNVGPKMDDDSDED